MGCGVFHIWIYVEEGMPVFMNVERRQFIMSVFTGLKKIPELACSGKVIFRKNNTKRERWSLFSPSFLQTCIS